MANTSQQTPLQGRCTDKPPGPLSSSPELQDPGPAGVVPATHMAEDPHSGAEMPVNSGTSYKPG